MRDLREKATWLDYIIAVAVVAGTVALLWLIIN